MEELKDKLTSLLYIHRRFLAYGFFGTVAIVLYIAVCVLSYKLLGFTNAVSNIISWTVTVFVSFITTKLYVFESKSMEKAVFFIELAKFTCAGILTGMIDLACMYIAVDVMDGPAVIVKAVFNVIVIVLSYVFSRLVVFRRHHEQKDRTDESGLLIRQFYSFQEWHDLRVMPFPVSSVHSAG
ncbi:MAG: GtrA family protein [Eubacteriaceae bacterium]|nr:GtrA family protein [Eubacteriaceae bacterium]